MNSGAYGHHYLSHYFIYYYRTFYFFFVKFATSIMENERKK